VVICVSGGASAAGIAATYGAQVVNQAPQAGLAELSTPGNQSVSSFSKTLSRDLRVLYAEAGASVTSPEIDSQQFHVAFDAGSDPSGYINQSAYQQVDQTGQGSQGLGATVAVLDTGATFWHPALAGHYVSGFNEIAPGTSPDDIADGVTNVALGHGTMVAGIVAVIAPQASIMPIRVLNADGIGSIVNVVQGIHDAVDNGATIINCSFDCATPSRALREAVIYATLHGALVVAAAGNQGTNTRHYPAAYETVLAVGSVEADNTFSTFSNYGRDVDVEAPGDGIYSTYYTGGYASWSGTSFAAPFVSGLGALLAGDNPYLGPHAIKYIIKHTAVNIDALNPGYAGQIGFGIIDIGAAETRALSNQ
jgi:subtilisin family serine protease